MSASIHDLLSSEHSRQMASYVAGLVIEDNARMAELMDAFFSDDLRTCQRAAWPMTIISDMRPDMFDAYVARMLDNLDRPSHDAVVRNTFRTFQNLSFDQEIEGMVFDKALDFLLQVDNAIAIRVFAMTVCANIAVRYPDLQEELIPIIEEQYPHGSAGFKSRAQKILKSFRRHV